MRPFEVNLHTVSHLKALSSGIESFIFNWRGRAFIDTTPIWKVLILLHTEPCERFVLLPFVGLRKNLSLVCLSKCKSLMNFNWFTLKFHNHNQTNVHDHMDHWSKVIKNLHCSDWFRCTGILQRQLNLFPRISTNF